ncbi:MAG: glycosyltransferase family 1 protein [Euryarchaeota archaeon]|nr:glycosyltransferase family 1 protein [Euryarchaeota archaeon]MDE1835292.1 glycosyltransferase family 1 protein [Euryarchaeota archaeon]MDE1881069.1 glycosyltransferase family 1 protein [Euryarchaeota archaeon]MDE2043588.1 glycosyltransferase family 1 protein [Thermoplasmata archaeon]
MTRRVLFVRDSTPVSPAHYLHRALEDEGADVYPIYIDRFRWSYQYGNRLPGLRSQWPDLYYQPSLGPLRRWGRFDLVLVSDWLRVPEKVLRLGKLSAFWAFDPELRPDSAFYDGRHRYRDLPPFDLIFNSQPTLGAWLKDDYPSSKVYTLPFAAPRHLYAGLHGARSRPSGFVGTLKAGKRLSFLRELERKVPGFYLPEDRLFTPWEYATEMSTLRASVNLSENHEVAIRAFEAVAAGCILVQDQVADLETLLGDELYRIGVVTFQEQDRAPEAIRTAVGRSASDPTVHDRIRALALRDHSYHARAREILRRSGLS